MKTTILILGLMLLLGGKIVFAGTCSDTPGISTSAPEINMKSVAPVTPKEATFLEAVETSNITYLSIFLRPLTPKTATFEDDLSNDPEMEKILKETAPVTPATADFPDNEKN
ncbi:MAG: hypothetical protein NTX61_17745 [Bacteroidetes bacterium]|nr:hypothetical protein [Bacteroidota bacterium]